MGSRCGLRTISTALISGRRVAICSRQQTVSGSDGVKTGAPGLKVDTTALGTGGGGMLVAAGLYSVKTNVS